MCLFTLFLVAFAVGNTLLESPSQETVAFKGFDRNKWYIPAVTLFLGEEVEWNLGDKDVCSCFTVTLAISLLLFLNVGWFSCSRL